MVISLGWLSPATSMRPTRSSGDPGRVSLLTWPCSDWGLPCRACYQTRGGLLPHLFTLTLGYRAVCSLWPYPSPCGAQALPGSLPCGARTFLNAPLLPVRCDHRAPPPPGAKLTSRARLRARLARQPPQRLGHTVARRPPGVEPAPRSGPLPCGEPEAVVLAKDERLQSGQVAHSHEGRGKLHRVHGVEAARAIGGEQTARHHLRGEDQQRAVRERKAAQQAEREPVSRSLPQPESEIQTRALLQYPVPDTARVLGNQRFECLVVRR